jgi:hypothetical protein
MKKKKKTAREGKKKHIEEQKKERKGGDEGGVGCQRTSVCGSSCPSITNTMAWLFLKTASAPNSLPAAPSSSNFPGKSHIWNLKNGVLAMSAWSRSEDGMSR